MEASRQCQQHIPLNQKQRPCTIPHTRRREVQGRVRHFGSGVCERVGIGPWTSCCMNAEEKGSDDLTTGIVYVDRWPASSTQTVLRPSTTLDLGRDSQTDGSFARRAEPGQVQPDRRAGTTASIAHIFCLDARYQPVTTAESAWRADEIPNHFTNLDVVPVTFVRILETSHDCGSMQIDKEGIFKIHLVIFMFCEAYFYDRRMISIIFM